jgi:hypothetical protein
MLDIKTCILDILVEFAPLIPDDPNILPSSKQTITKQARGWKNLENL